MRKTIKENNDKILKFNNLTNEVVTTDRAYCHHQILDTSTVKRFLNFPVNEFFYLSSFSFFVSPKKETKKGARNRKQPDFGGSLIELVYYCGEGLRFPGPSK